MVYCRSGKMVQKFKELDVNGDGSISKKEFMTGRKGPPLQIRHYPLPYKALPLQIRHCRLPNKASIQIRQACSVFADMQETHPTHWCHLRRAL